MTSHTKRVLTSLVLILVLGYLIFWASLLELALGALALSGMGLWEFFSLFWPGSQRVWLKCIGIVLAVPLVMHNLLGIPALGAVLFSLWAMNAMFLVQFGRGRSEIDWQGLQIVSLGLLYIPLALQFLVGLAAEEILLVLLSAFATDIFAYYFGSWWGKRRMWPAVSPKKTWMGAAGGVLGCLAVSLAFGLSVGTAPWMVWIGLGVALNIAAQLGDFFLSALKRRQEVKDSGKLLPGHGGFLDRFDSVLLVLPAYMLFQSLYPLF